ncbi:hypothetical protein [Desulfosarcina cetonica]|uniref:hypothetical protein n=1 Tax=Desulfosarcina cetonica TaxID=90730 RepID=UPI0006D2288F|nr:hypothetical protein [Desulfosarcina cetonica]
MDEPLAALARRLNGSPRPVVVCGTEITLPDDIASAADLAEALRPTHKSVGLFFTLDGANAFAAALIGDAVLSMETLAGRISDGTLKALILVEADSRVFTDRPEMAAALNRLEQVVVMDYLASPLNSVARHFIPTQTVYEYGGRWINQEGRLQSAMPVMTGGEPLSMTGGGDHPPRVFGPTIPGDDPMVAWRALTQLAGDDPATATSEARLRAALADFHPAVPSSLSDGRIDLTTASGAIEPTEALTADAQSRLEAGIALLLVADTFGTEPLSSGTPALDELAVASAGRMHPETLTELGLVAGGRVTLAVNGGSLDVPIDADPAMAPGVLVIPRQHGLDWQLAGETRLIIDRSAIATEPQHETT